MLVLYLAFRDHKQCHQFFCAFTLLSFPSRNPPWPQNSNWKYPPCLWISSSKNLPLPTEFQKATLGLGMDIVWNHALYFGVVWFCFYYFMSSVTATWSICCSKKGFCSQDVALFKSPWHTNTSVTRTNSSGYGNIQQMMRDMICSWISMRRSDSELWMKYSLIWVLQDLRCQGKRKVLTTQKTKDRHIPSQWVTLPL